MSVIFHIATGRDWERATSTGTYTTESMHSHGAIRCFSPARHAAAANHLFAGRTDLVLLLIDTDSNPRSASSGLMPMISRFRACTAR